VSAVPPLPGDEICEYSAAMGGTDRAGAYNRREGGEEGERWPEPGVVDWPQLVDFPRQSLFIVSPKREFTTSHTQITGGGGEVGRKKSDCAWALGGHDS
jgi:hypothetical protein